MTLNFFYIILTRQAKRLENFNTLQHIMYRPYWSESMKCWVQFSNSYSMVLIFYIFSRSQLLTVRKLTLGPLHTVFSVFYYFKRPDKVSMSTPCASLMYKWSCLLYAVHRTKYAVPSTVKFWMGLQDVMGIKTFRCEKDWCNVGAILTWDSKSNEKHTPLLHLQWL